MRREEVFECEEFLRADQSDDALVRFGLGAEGKLFAGLGADADAELAAERDKLLKPGVVALAGHQHVVKTAAAGAQSLLDRVQAVQNFHEY